MVLITIEQSDSKKSIQVKDGDDYLEFVTFFDGKWFAVCGKIGNTAFRSRDGLFWTKCGRGKMTTEVMSKLNVMDDFFRKSRTTVNAPANGYSPIE